MTVTLDTLTALGGESNIDASADQSYPSPYAGLNPETTEIGCAANYENYMPTVGEFESTIPVAEGVFLRVTNIPDPTVGGHQGYGDTLTFRTGLRDTRWLTQEFDGQTMALPMTGVNPPGVVGESTLYTTVVLGSNAALAGSPLQTPQQNIELYSEGLPTGVGDANYG